MKSAQRIKLIVSDLQSGFTEQEFVRAADYDELKKRCDFAEQQWHIYSATRDDPYDQVHAELDALLAEVREWACEACQIVYPGPPQAGFKCVTCPKCGGLTMPHTLLQRRKAESERDALRQDATRYRWLRTASKKLKIWDDDDWYYGPSPERVDAFCDASLTSNADNPSAR